MAKTLLNGVNEVLSRVRVIDGDTSALSALTSSSIQSYIDLAVQVLNETIEELYTQIDTPIPQELASSTITLVADDRDYSLASDLVQLHWPLQDQTNGVYIHEYPGGYLGLIQDQPIPANYTGLPRQAAISPVNGELYLDRLPTSDDAGRVYTYQYDKDISLSAATDTFPFSDAVFRAIVPAAAQMWRRDRENTFDSKAFDKAMGRAAKIITQGQQRESWGPYRVRGARRGPDFQTPFNG